jgi:hypothetical protein
MPDSHRAQPLVRALDTGRKHPFAEQGERLSVALYALFDAFRITIGDFLPVISGLGLYPRNTVSRSHVLAILAGDRRLTRKTAQNLVDRLNVFLEGSFDRCANEGATAEMKRSLRRVAFLRVASHSSSATADDLFKFYNGEVGLQSTTAGADNATERAMWLEVFGDAHAAELSEEQQRQWAMEMVRQGRFRIGRSESSAKITLSVTEDVASEILSRYVDGEFEERQIVLIRRIAPPTNKLTRFVLLPSKLVEAGTPDTSPSYSEAWNKATLVASLVRPLRRLRWIFSPSIRSTPLVNVFRSSESRFYASELSGQQSAFVTDLQVCWVAWPILTAAVLFLVLWIFGLRTPIDLGLGLLCGMTLAFLGAQVCSSVISPLGCSAGGVLMALCFGVAQGMILGRARFSPAFSGDNIRQNPFISVTGGIVGLVAPRWRDHFSAVEAILLLLLVAIAIAIAGWLMAQPANANRPIPRDALIRDLLRGFAGSLAGLFIGAVYGMTILLASFGLTKLFAFGIAFTLIGGFVFGATIWLGARRTVQTYTPGVSQSPPLAKAVWFFAAHMTISIVLLCATFAEAGQVIGLVALAASTAWFHSTWFTAAHILSIRLGSPRSAVIATTLEGAVGFAAFILIRALT